MNNTQVVKIAEKIMELSYHETSFIRPYTVKRKDVRDLLPPETFDELSRFDYVAAIILSEFTNWSSRDIAEWVGGRQYNYINGSEYQMLRDKQNPSPFLNEEA